MSINDNFKKGTEQVKLSRKYKKRIKRLIKRVLNRLGGIVTVFFASLAMCKLMGFSVPLNKLFVLKTDIIPKAEPTSELEIIENEDMVIKSNDETFIQDNLESTTIELNTVLTTNRLENTDTITYIYTVQDLVDFRDSVNAGDDYAEKTVYLMDDIDMSSVCSETVGSWIPIGETGIDTEIQFAGTFDGNYHTISNLYCNSSEYQYLGLFGVTATNGIIQNVIFKDVNINNTYNVVSAVVRSGAIAAYNQGTILNCGVESGNIITTKTSANTTSGSYPGAYSGGICSSNKGTIFGCYNKANVEAYAPVRNYNEAYVGGIAASNFYAKVENCYNAGVIQGNSYGLMCGGIVGGSQLTSGKTGYVKNCYNRGTFTGSFTGSYGYLGGLIGRNGYSATCYAMPLTNNYCLNNCSYSYYGWNGSAITSYTSGRTKADTLKTYALTLGYAYANDPNNINNGYPVLKWEVSRYKIVENQEYIKTGESRQLTLEKIMSKPLENENDINWTWKSSNEDVATIDENGVITGKGVGYTTITAYNSENDLKSKAIINVYRNEEGAITVPQVDIGDGFTIILKEDGTVWSTGKNDVGQLGDGTTTNRNILRQVKIDENTYLTNIKKIAVGYDHIIALTINGEAYAWGGNGAGKLGQGDTTSRLYATQIKGVNGQDYIEDIIDIAVGDVQSYLLNSNGDTYGIGYNKWRQIDDSEVDSLYPKIIKELDETIKLTSGYSNVGALKISGEAWIRGHNLSGVYGNNTVEGKGLYIIEKNINEFILKGFYAVILKEDGTVWTSGRNEVGQLGLGDTTDRKVYTQVKFSDGTEVKAKTISGGSRNLQFIGEDGKIYVTGYNGNGQLSNGSTTNAKYPTVMKNADGTEVTDCILLISGGNANEDNSPRNIGIVRKNGTVWLSGNNTYGQMGNGTNEGSNYLTQVGKDLLKYQEETIVIGVNEIRMIRRDLFRYEPKINVFISRNTWVPSLVYEIEDDNIASVTNEGVILGISKGTTRIKVTDETTNTTTYIEVNVKDSSLESIIVNEPFSGSTITRTPTLNTQTGEHETKIKHITNNVSVEIRSTDSNARIEYIDKEGNIIQNENGEDIKEVGTLTISVDTLNDRTYVYYRIVSESETESTIYTLKIDKMSNNTLIDGINVDEEPATSEADGSYSAVVKGSKQTSVVQVIKNEDKQTIYIDGTEGETKEITLTGIKTTVRIKVKAEDGTIEEKTLVITRTTSISGKILTENHEGKHLSKIVVFRTEDTRPEDLENRVNPDGTINTTVREVVGEAETKEDGSYEIDLYVTDITPVVDSDANGITDTLEKQYDVLVIKDGYLRYRVTNIELTEGETVDLGTYELLAGDVVETEEININDLVSENNNVGVTVDDTNKQDKEKYDFNEDGDIDGIDREILKKNFGKKSEVVQWISPTTYSLKRMRRKENEEADDLEGTSEVKVKELMILPIECDYEITSPYGERIHPVTGVVSRHTGIDLGGEHHTPIFAVADGEVVFSGVQKAFGNCIEIKHEIEGEIIYTFYAHLSRIDVKEGDKVTQGQIIGLEGGDPNTDPNPGSSTGHHLHFEIRKASGYGNDIDPKKYLKF